MTSTEKQYRESLAELVQWMNAQGWSPGTSTNYSFLHPENDAVVVVSKSGIDKAIFQSSDFMHVDFDGVPTATYAQLKSSAETLIHTAIYKMFPDTRVILHTHSKPATMLSHLHAKDKAIVFSGYEVLKGLPMQVTHDTAVKIPIFANDQDMHRFSLMIQEHEECLNNCAFLIEKHGLYVWGNSLFDAKRHLEIYEFLLDITLNFKTIG